MTIYLRLHSLIYHVDVVRGSLPKSVRHCGAHKETIIMTAKIPLILIQAIIFMTIAIAIGVYFLHYFMKHCT